MWQEPWGRQEACLAPRQHLPLVWQEPWGQQEAYLATGLETHHLALPKTPPCSSQSSTLPLCGKSPGARQEAFFAPQDYGKSCGANKRLILAKQKASGNGQFPCLALDKPHQPLYGRGPGANKRLIWPSQKKASGSGQFPCVTLDKTNPKKPLSSKHNLALPKTAPCSCMARALGHQEAYLANQKVSGLFGQTKGLWKWPISLCGPG